MPGADSKHPPPACVEDWDEDAETTISFTRATANVAVKRSSTSLYADPTHLKYHRDGSDSGYSSRAGTVASASTGGRKPPNLSVDTSLPERQRHPYSMTPQARPSIRRDSSGRPSAAEYGQAPVPEKPFVHPPGVCWTCDRVGYHVDPQEYTRLTQPSTPASPKVSKKSSRVDQDSEPRLRRMSSNREGRPQSIYPPSTTQSFYPPNTAYQSPGYSTPMTPQSQTPYGHDPMIYTYAVATPITSTYVGYPGQSDYFASRPAEKQRPPKPSRRSSIYGEPVIQQPKREESRTVEKAPSKEARPTIKSHRSSRSIDQQKADRDRDAMPPPERPSQRAEVTRRPSIKKSATYNTAIVDHRRSRGSEDRDYRELQMRQPSPSRNPKPPPSAYKHVAQPDPTPSRPNVQRKSVSYSDPVTTTKIASSIPEEYTHQPHHPRRNTAPTKPPTTHERQTADAEAYIQRKSLLTAEELTAEKIAELKSSRRTVSSRSETGSAISHRSHQSSSKASSGRQRSRTSGQTSGQRTSILLDGGIKLDIPKDYMEKTGRPLSMQFGDLSISVGQKDKVSVSSSKSSKEQRMIEKAPSVVSRESGSRRSGADSSRSSKGKEREGLERRASHVSDSRPPVSGESRGHSQRSSRAPSSTRAGVDYGRSRRKSVEYDQNTFMYAA